MISLKECDIAERISKIKLSGKKVHSNCFNRFLNSDYTWDGDFSEYSLFIVFKDKGVNRVWFYTIDFKDLQVLFETKLEENKEYLIEIIAKDRELYSEEIKLAGFDLLTTMKRMSNKDISQIFNSETKLLSYFEKVKGEKPFLQDAKAIKDKLWEIFDNRISHLPNQNEIEDGIKKGEFTIFKNQNSEIITILQSVVKPRSFYINQVYNVADKEVIHAILLTELKKYCETGGKYLYAWVEECNIASCKFHEKYGMEHDGLWDVIYVKGNNEEKKPFE